MMLINEGEQSARVVALQILLNRKNKNRVVTDGTFGPLTSGAIDQVRELLGISTGPKGVADPGLCRLLVENAGLQWIDSVDVTDPCRSPNGPLRLCWVECRAVWPTLLSKYKLVRAKTS